MREKKTEGIARGVHGAVKPTIITLLCAVCIVAILLAPGVLLKLRDEQLLDTFYPVELSDVTIANPELTANVALVNAAAMQSQRNIDMEEMFGGERMRAYEKLLASVTPLYEIGLLPPTCMMALSIYPDDENFAMFYGQATRSGFELEVYRLENYYVDDAAYPMFFYYFYAIMYEDKVLYLDMYAEPTVDMVDYWGDGLTREEHMEVLAEFGAQVASVVEEVAPAPEYDEALSLEDRAETLMWAYIDYLGVGELEDWQVLVSENYASAVSHYSLLRLVVDWWEEEYGYSRVSLYPQY